MKKLTILFLFLVPFVLTLQNGCSLMNSIFPDVDFDAELEADVDLEVADASRGTFGNSVKINPRDQDDNLSKYADRISKLEIIDLYATVVDTITKDFTLLYGNISISNQNGQTGWNFQNEDIYLGKTLRLDNKDGQWDVTNAILGGLPVITVGANGETDEDSLFFRVKIKFKVKGSAEPY